MKYILLISGILFSHLINAQMKWLNVDSLYQPLPADFQIFKTTGPVEGKPNIAFYVKIPLKDKSFVFDADTTFRRRITPSAYYERNNHPLVVVNCTFFLQDNSNANVVVDRGRLVSFNIPSYYSRSDSVYYYTTRSALGIDRK